MVAKLKCLLTKGKFTQNPFLSVLFLLLREKVCSFSCAFLLVFSALCRVLLLYILIKILLKNFGYKQYRRSMGEGGREPASPPPNCNASNDKFVTKTAILSSFSWFVFTMTRDCEDLFVFLLFTFFSKKNSALQTVAPVLVLLFWSSLFKLWSGPPSRS